MLIGKTLANLAKALACALACNSMRNPYWRANMLTIATVHESNLFDEIYCVCDDPARRNRWIAVFRGMGVAIFDLRD